MYPMLTFFVAAFVAAVVAIIFSLPTSLLKLDQVLAPPQIPGTHDYLHSSTVISVTGAVGPESLIFDPNGEGPYTGVADGRILKWTGDGRGWTDFAVTSSDRYNFIIILLFLFERMVYCLTNMIMEWCCFAEPCVIITIILSRIIVELLLLYKIFGDG